MLATEVPPNFITTVAILNGFPAPAIGSERPRKDLSSLDIWIESRLLSGSRAPRQLPEAIQNGERDRAALDKSPAPLATSREPEPRMTAATSPHADPTPETANLDPEEVRRFSEIASEWWDPNGKFRPLHQIGPPRLSFIRDQAVAHFGRDAKILKPLAGLTALDIGCGGGLVSEPLTRMGATVTAIDPSERNIAIAKSHAEAQGLAIDYRPVRVEDLVAEKRTFDIVACLEVVEHVPDPQKFIAECAALVRPGGLAVFSTLNRTFKAWALAIVGAEYVLGWLPRGTHQWDRFVTTEELRRYAETAGLTTPQFEGITYTPMRDVWARNPDTDVNYLMSAKRPMPA
jgi:2-polyprenyl-6-hydroxyphenyl methylase/3-demethylubiquinone-9 3-methyltransferase